MGCLPQCGLALTWAVPSVVIPPKAPPPVSINAWMAGKAIEDLFVHSVAPKRSNIMKAFVVRVMADAACKKKDASASFIVLPLLGTRCRSSQ